MSQPIFSRTAASLPGLSWQGSLPHWHAVNDTLRGGSSQSALRVLKDGSALFSGFLDTTTLGGAGFASQAYQQPLPVSLSPVKHAGLCLTVRRRAAPSTAAAGTDAPTSPQNQPGGGRAPVTHYVLTLRTEEPAIRPDGRRESVIAYEFRFELSPATAASSGAGADAEDNDGPLVVLHAPWHAFEPHYRGRPKPDAPLLRPQDVKACSFMARSDFGSQSGDFAVRLVELATLPLDERKTAMEQAGSEVPSLSPAGSSERSAGGRADARSAAADEKATSAGSGLSPPRSVLPLHDGESAARLRSEACGFTLYLLMTLLALLWLLWALLPDRALRALGIGWYPARHWAYLIPAWSAIAVLATYAMFLARNLSQQGGLDELCVLVDSHANILPASAIAADEKHPLDVNSLRDTGAEGHAFSGDLYALPPGVVSARRFHFNAQ